MRQNKKNNKTTGAVGEETAVRYLQEKGYRILERNFSNSLGELDIIAMEREVLVIVEVKTRKSLEYGYPREAVDLPKQRNIIRVTNSYLSRKNFWSLPVRFDVIEIILGNKTKINHFKNAFSGE